MALRREILGEFRFDEALKKHSYMEDDLFSYSIYKKYPKGLYITPFAKCIHKASPAGRIENDETQRTKKQYRRYVLIKMFGVRGNFLYFWQILGFTVEDSILRLGRYALRNSEIST